MLVPLVPTPGPLDRLNQLFDEETVLAALGAGASYTNVARAYGATLAELARWISAVPSRRAAVDAARVEAARYWDEMAEEQINTARSPFELKKAESLAAHYRWRATKLSPDLYAERRDVSLDTSLKVEVIRFGNDPPAE